MSERSRPSTVRTEPYEYVNRTPWSILTFWPLYDKDPWSTMAESLVPAAFIMSWVDAAFCVPHPINYAWLGRVMKVVSFCKVRVRYLCMFGGRCGSGWVRRARLSLLWLKPICFMVGLCIFFPTFIIRIVMDGSQEVFKNLSLSLLTYLLAKSHCR